MDMNEVIKNTLKKQALDLEKSSSFIAEQNSKRIRREEELTEASKEIAVVISEFKDIVKKFIEASEQQTKSNNKLNTMLFYFTIISVIATVISTVIAIIQFTN